MNMTLEIVVVAIVLLVIAVVVLAFFSQGMNQGQQMTDARNQCITMASASCQSFKVMPPTWNIPTVNTNKGLQSCDILTESKYGDCSKFGVTGGGAQSGGGGAAITTSAQCAAGGGTCMAACAYPLSQQRGACSDNPTNKNCCGS